MPVLGRSATSEGIRLEDNSLTEITQQEKDIKLLLDRAIEQQEPFAKTGESARFIYGGGSEIALSARAPTSRKNFFKKAVTINVAKAIGGNPVAKVVAVGDVDDKKVDGINNHVNSVYSKESALVLLQKNATDATMFGNTYVMIHNKNRLEWLYWFDVFVDNALATPDNMWNGRYVFIRRFHDSGDFFDAYSEVLKDKFDKKEAKELTKASNVMGRKLAGSSVTTQLRTVHKEKVTSVPHNLFGVPGADLYQNPEGNMDGLVAEWQAFILDQVDKDGNKTWSEYFLYEGRLIWKNGNKPPDSKDNEIVNPIPEDMPNPSIVNWSRTTLNGQFYQPSLFVDVIPSQSSYNFMNGVIAQLFSMLDNPAFKGAEEDREALKKWMNTVGEALILNNPAAFDVIETHKPDASMFTTMDYIQKDLEADSGVTDVTTGVEPQRETSGIAIQRLQSGADVYFTPLLTGRDEFLNDITRWLTFFYLDGDQAVLNDLGFSYKIIPKMTQEEKFQQLLVGMSAAMQAVQGTPLEQDPIARVKLAGVMTGNVDEADELVKAIQEIITGQPAPPDPAQQEEEGKEADHQRALEMKELEGDQKMDEITVDGEIKIALDEEKAKHETKDKALKREQSTGKRKQENR